MTTSGHPTDDAMLYVGGSKTSFRCEDCGANVFRKASETAQVVKYRCNGCDALYSGERRSQ